MPQQYHPLDTVILFGVVVVFQLLGVLRRTWAARSGRAVLPRRLTPVHAMRLLGWRLGLVGFLSLTYARGGWSAESVGLASALPLPLALLIGVILYGGLALLYDASTKRLDSRADIMQAAFRANASLWPRQRNAKVWAGIAIMVLNPVTEEVLMRGILVHQLGQLTGSPVIPIAVGLVVNGVLHSYQGPRMIAWHMLFYGFTIALLYSPLGLIGAIRAHVAGDAIPIITLRHQAREWRELMRRTSSLAARSAQ